MSRLAIVTGAAQGIGAAISARLLADGWHVARLDKAFQTKGEGRWPFDLGRIDDHQRIISEIIAEHGPVSALINNAGIASPKRGDFLDLEPETFDKLMDINLRGTVFFTQTVLKAHQGKIAEGKIAESRRKIVFITSASAELASLERLDYCMSKAALAMFVKGLALRLAGEGVDVFEIRPGIIRTQMTAGASAKYDALIAGGRVPEGRWGEPEDIAAVTASLVSGAIPFSTGSVIEAGGGLTIPRL